MSGSRWYRAACTAYFRGALAGGDARPAPAGDGPSEQYRIAAWDARLTDVEEVAAPPPFDADGVGGLGAPFRSLGTTVWIRAAEPAETSEWFQSRAEILWITDWDVLESVRADGRISGRLRGTAYVEVKEIAPPTEPTAVVDPVVPPPETLAPTNGDDRWLATQGINIPRTPSFIDSVRRPGCGWAGGLAGLSTLILSCCCGIGFFVQWLGGAGVGIWLGLGALFGIPIALGLLWFAWRLWSVGESHERSGCAPRIFAIVLLLGVLLACLGAARFVASLFGYGSPAVSVPMWSGSEMGCGHTAIGYRDRVGARIRVTCPASCTLQRVWGTDVYTDDSSICVAAQHAELLSGGPGTVTIFVREGRDEYIASSRNGVESHPWGRWGGSFSFCDGPRPGTQCPDSPRGGSQRDGGSSKPVSTPQRGATSPRPDGGSAAVPAAALDAGAGVAPAATPPAAARAERRDATGEGSGTGRRFLVPFSVSVDPHDADGSAWDVLLGRPDLSICVTTDERRCAPVENEDKPDEVLPCDDDLRCSERVPIVGVPRVIHVEVIDRDWKIDDVVGEGDCEFGRICHVGRARVSVGMPDPVESR